jgi:hypothetical protein
MLEVVTTYVQNINTLRLRIREMFTVL